VHSLRFLVSRRWIAFALIVALLAWLAWFLGEWQFGRLADRKEQNTIIQRNEDAGPSPVAEVMAPGRPVSKQTQWRIVEATGTYAVEDTIIVRYRTRQGEAGVDVVVPLELSDGTSLLVDRGWYATDNRGATTADVPAPPAGEVTVTGWARADATGDSTQVTEQSTRAVNSGEIAQALDREVFGGWVDLRSESPEPAQALLPVELPELNNGPHFFYGLQWWFFGALAIFGFFFLLYEELRGSRSPWSRRSTSTPDTGEGASPTATPGAATAAAAPRAAPAVKAPAPKRKTWRERLDRGEDWDDEPPTPSSQGTQKASVDREHHAGHE
jgi:cytochrome oxidase assembly protein ShyY1